MIPAYDEKLVQERQRPVLVGGNGCRENRTKPEPEATSGLHGKGCQH